MIQYSETVSEIVYADDSLTALHKAFLNTKIPTPFFHPQTSIFLCCQIQCNVYFVSSGPLRADFNQFYYKK